MADTCDTCLQPCQGGEHHYTDSRGHQRIGCQDEHACATAWSKLTPELRRHGGHDCKAVERGKAVGR